jgi:hypothetical protein
VTLMWVVGLALASWAAISVGVVVLAGRVARGDR